MDKVSIKPVIIGGGPAGLSTAIMLAKRGYKDIKVYERLPEYPRSNDVATWQRLRSYVIGINGRGQNVLKWLGVMDRFDKLAVTVLGRKDWSPENNREEPKATFHVFHFTSLYFTSLHFTSLYFTLLHFTSLHFTSLHFTSLHFTSFI